MYRPPSGNMLRAPPSTPARPAQHNLHPIRTTSLQPTQSPSAPQSSVSAPPEQPYPVYPIPIPDEKLEKALRLYKIYKAARYEEELASRQLDPQSAMSNHHGYHLSVPGTPTPRSATSRTSSQRRRAESVSTSNYGGVTDISSVISFEGNESPSKSKNELSTWDGKKVKTRRRQKFPKAAKAKTALVRHLGSCWVCHKRRVPCDLEQHHDIKTLESLLKSKSNAKRSVSAPQAPTYSSISDASQQNASSSSTQLGSSGNIQTNELFGMGQNEHLQTSTPLDVTHLDMDPSTFDDPNTEISAPATHYYPQPDLSSFASSSNLSYQNGGMFPIGVRRGGYFHCQHVLCPDYFNNAEDVQLHFEMSHFAFTRLIPAHRYVCASCDQMYEMSTGTCYNCGTLGRIEIRIYGNYIQTPSYQKYSTDGHDLQNNSSSTPYYPSAYNVPNSGLQEGADMNGGDFNGGGFNGGTNPGNYYFQADDSFGNEPSSSNQDFGYNQYDNMGANGNGNQYHGQGYRHATHNFQEKTHLARRTQTFRWQRLLFALAILSLAVTLCFSYTGPFTKLRSFLVRSIARHMPVLGFVVIVAPLAMCSIVKHFTVQRVRSAQCRPQKCPLHTLRSRPMRWMGCRQTAPDTYIRGGIHS